ncbi:cytochrome P450 [Streptomyces sp. NPDC048282]|uniref:cytochrome P450 n=1 Tax=Streptomyces sp. NPDC048282 TaxID=3365528 RepID=UPI0037235A35
MDPFGYQDALREECPIAYSPVYEGFWVLTRYQDHREVLQQPESFSSRIVGVPGAKWYAGNELLPLTLDPPQHTKYRALINPAFSPRRITALEKTVREQSVRLIEEILAAGTGSTEFMAEFAEPLPSLVFTAMLGLPSSEYRQFVRWVDTMLHTPPTEEGVRVRQQAGEQINGYLTELIAERRAHPRDDMVSDLIDSEVDGERLSDSEVRRVCFLLFSAGLETVTTALGWGFRYLAEHPQVRRRLVDAPELAEPAVEEILRLHSFVNHARTVTRDLDFHGVRMREGDRVLLLSGAAGRDPRQFPDPTTFDFGRKPNRHIAFSLGPHRCAGSHLARLELRIALEEWHARIPEYAIPEGAEVPVHAGGVAGVERLALAF